MYSKQKKLKLNKKLNGIRIPSENLSTVNTHSLVDPLYGSILLTIFVLDLNEFTSKYIGMPHHASGAETPKDLKLHIF